MEARPPPGPRVGRPQTDRPQTDRPQAGKPLASRARDRRAFSYDPRAIERGRQRAWEASEAFRTPLLKAEQSGVYIKASAPFTSGNVHIGHVRSYAIGDAYARFQRARGEPVLFAFGFDAFGLPAELGAIANGESPAEWVARCAEHMTGQLKRLGFSFDWERTFMSSDPIMYRWSQWLFLTLLDAGLIYHGSGSVDWCDTCQTTLATIQVEDGTCWRCHNPVRLIQRAQWYLRISAYLEENDRRIGELEKWDETSLASQRFVLGRADGVELRARAEDGRELTVFTPHAEGVARARFVLISPKHPEVERWSAGRRGGRAAGGDAPRRLGAQLARRGDGRAGGHRLHCVATRAAQPLPLLISPAVDERFGATAVLGIPELRSHRRVDRPAPRHPHGGAGRRRRRGGGSRRAGRPERERLPLGHARTRQEDRTLLAVRPTGATRPTILHLPSARGSTPIRSCMRACGMVPIPKEQLPVELPRHLKPTGAGNPLAERRSSSTPPAPAATGLKPTHAAPLLLEDLMNSAPIALRLASAR